MKEFSPFDGFEAWHCDRFGYKPTSEELKRWRMVTGGESRVGHERLLPELPISSLPEQPNPDFFKPPY